MREKQNLRTHRAALVKTQKHSKETWDKTESGLVSFCDIHQGDESGLIFDPRSLRDIEIVHVAFMASV